MVRYMWTRVVIIILCCVVGYIMGQDHDQAHDQVRYQDQRKRAFLTQRHKADQRLQTHQQAADYYHAYKFYYDGVPDKYDALGNKIKGVEPDPKRALGYLRHACELSGNPQLWLMLGSIYQNGMYKLEPDLPMAQRIYTYLLNNFPNRDIQYEVQDRLTDIITEINTAQTYRWLNLKREPKRNAHHEKIKNMLGAAAGAGAGPARHTRPGAAINVFGTAGTVVNQLFRAPNPIADEVNGLELDINDVRFNDRHNTHNSQVVGTVAYSLNRLKEGTELKKSLPETIREIRNFLSSKPNCDRKADALKSLDSIERNIIPISSIGMKETDALNIVWNRINSDQHKQHQDDIKDIMYQQLADMQEHGKSVCATGRLSRLMDTFSTFDKDVEIKPTYIINQEMMAKAGKMREDLYSGYDNNTADQLRAGTADPHIQEQFDKHARETIINQLTKDYVDTGIMTENAFVKNVDGWIDEI